MNFPNMGNLGNMDFSALMQAKQAWETFKQNHPKFPAFLQYIANRGLPEGAEIKISVEYPDDPKPINATIKVKPSDVDLFNLAKSFLK